MFDIKEGLKRLPDCPGVYLHKNAADEIIYVGKAVSLKNRVRQYFQASSLKNPKLKALREQIAEFEYITCGSEMEALILECNLIKKYRPKYNVLLKDDKSYPYIALTLGEPFPRLIKTRRILNDGSKYYGPFSDVGAVNRIIDNLNRLFALKTCKARDFKDGFKPCLNFHIAACQGVCTGAVSKEEYANSIKTIESFFSGDKKKNRKILEDKMNEASAALNFETAALYRDILEDMEALNQLQRASTTAEDNIDIVLPVSSGDDEYSIVLFNIRSGQLVGRSTHIMEGMYLGKDETVGQFLKQYYTVLSGIPSEIIIEKSIPDQNMIETLLGEEGHKVHIYTPIKGRRKALLLMAQKDRDEMTKGIKEKNDAKLERISTLKKELSELLKEHFQMETKLAANFRCEAYDISNTNGVDSVGAMIVSIGMNFAPKEYRRFKVKTIEGPNDYGSTQEVIYRRFKRALDGDKSFSKLPDIIFMDGGIGHVNACNKVLSALGLNIPVIGLAKGKGHRTSRMVFNSGCEIDLKKRGVLYSFCGRLQEEVHRFAISYHHNIRGKQIGSVLDNIEGIGPKKRNLLLEHFKSVDQVRSATLDELCKVEGITFRLAKKIQEYFRSE